MTLRRRDHDISIADFTRGPSNRAMGVRVFRWLSADSDTGGWNDRSTDLGSVLCEFVNEREKVVELLEATRNRSR